MYPCNAMKGIRLPWDAQGFSIEQLNLWEKLRIMSSGAGEAVKSKVPGHWNNNVRIVRMIFEL
jgi:hypothetical protein